MKQKALHAEMSALHWGPDPASLKVLSKAQFDAAVASGSAWSILDGFVVDVSLWAAQHPGGSGLVRSAVGKDITADFKGEYYKHSNAANNVAAPLRSARIEGYWAK